MNWIEDPYNQLGTLVHGILQLAAGNVGRLAAVFAGDVDWHVLVKVVSGGMIYTSVTDNSSELVVQCNVHMQHSEFFGITVEITQT